MHGLMPVGVFDSGLGGLSVLSEIQQLLPNESLIYVADSAYVPYGEKTAEQIVERSIRISEFLLDSGVKALVVACNTATAAAIQPLRERWPGLIIVGMEPAVKPAAEQSQHGKIGVLATTGTLRSAKFAALLERYSSRVQVLTQPCPGLVERIEAGELASPATRELLEGYVRPLLSAGCDSLILGCTHYPFIKPLLREMVGDEIAIIDTGAAVARRLHCLLDEAGLMASGPAATPALHSTGDIRALQQALPALWPGAADVQELHL